MFAYGKSRTRYENGVSTSRRRIMPVEEWKAFVRDKYPAYVSWNDFQKIAAMLRENHSDYIRRQTSGVPRDGKALLQGIVCCGHCGHKMTLQYKGQTRYVCSMLNAQTRIPSCQNVLADQIDPHVLQWFFEALSVADIDLSARTLAQADERRAGYLQAQRQQVERLRHEAHLAERQHRHSEPENRLVTGELERRWEQALRSLRQAEEQLAVQERSSDCWAIPADLREMLAEIGPRLRMYPKPVVRATSSTNSRISRGFRGPPLGFLVRGSFSSRTQR